MEVSFLVLILRALSMPSRQLYLDGFPSDTFPLGLPLLVRVSGDEIFLRFGYVNFVEQQ